MKSAVRTTDVSWSYKEYDVVGTPTARDVRGKRTDAYDWLYEVRDASGRRLHEGYFKSLEASMQFIDAIVRGND